MPDNDDDPAANTQMFQAFVDRGRAEESKDRSVPGALTVIAAVALLLVLAIVVLKMTG